MIEMKGVFLFRVFASFCFLIIAVVILTSAVVASTSNAPGLSNKPDKIKVEPQGNKVKVTDISDDNKKETKEDQDTYETEELEVELEDETDDNELGGEEENPDSVTVRAHDNASYVIQNNLQTKTNFPLKVNYETGELIVTTPKGEKVVTILPQAAIQHMLAAKVLDQLGGKGGYYWDLAQPSPTPQESPEPEESPEPGESPNPSPSSEPIVEAQTAITLTVDENGFLVYEISGAKSEKFLGLLSVKLPRIAVISADTGQVMEIKQKILTKLLDSLSF